MQSSYELIIIDDGSRDKTLSELLSIEIDFVRYPNLKSVTLYRNRLSRFETFCDTFGMEISRGKYLLEVQADMLIDDVGFDLRLIECFRVDQKIVAISGRGVETLAPIILDYKQVLGTDRARTSSFARYLIERANYQVKRLIKSLILFKNHEIIANKHLGSAQYFREKQDDEFLVSGCAGRLGQLINFNVDPANFSRKLYIGQTVMRGPLMFDREKYFNLGGLDKFRFFQGFDDHDFSARALLNGLKVAYTPVSFESPLELGSTRRSRSLVTEILIAVYTLRIKKARLSTALNGDAILKAICDQNLS
jgi:glycosyltransferase involved in cell wall biosynthesis